MKKICILAAFALAGCSNTMPASDMVKIAVAEQEVAGCKYLSEVRGDHNLWGGMMVQVAIDDATAQLKNKTAQAGGNTVLVTKSSSHMAGANMAGKAYRC